MCTCNCSTPPRIPRPGWKNAFAIIHRMTSFVHGARVTAAPRPDGSVTLELYGDQGDGAPAASINLDSAGRDAVLRACIEAAALDNVTGTGGVYVAWLAPGKAER